MAEEDVQAVEVQNKEEMAKSIADKITNQQKSTFDALSQSTESSIRSITVTQTAFMETIFETPVKTNELQGLEKLVRSNLHGEIQRTVLLIYDERRAARRAAKNGDFISHYKVNNKKIII